MSSTGRVVVGVDGSEEARRALAWAVDEARRRGAAVEAVHAWTYLYGPGAHVASHEAMRNVASSLLDAVVDSVGDTGGVDVRRTLVEGRPVAALLDVARGADLLVVGARGRGGFTGLLLGSVSQQLSHHPPCPVVVVPRSPEERPGD